MTGGQMMVVLIVAIVMIASIIKGRHGYPQRRRRGGNGAAVEHDPEKQALIDEVRQLRERVQVLERITVEKENSLERQIEELRHR